MTKAENLYSIPARFRRMENLHIVFWLLKDLGWCLFWKPLGIAMIVPTLAIAVFITYRTRQLASELAHNLAIIFWISANSFWMISEFFGFDGKEILFGITGKHWALLPFSLGILTLLFYYLFIRPREAGKGGAVTM